MFANNKCGVLPPPFQANRTSKQTRGRLQKICALLSSNILGERQAAAAAIQRILPTRAANDNTRHSRKWRWSFNPHTQAVICLQWPEALTDQEIPIIAKIATAGRTSVDERRLLIEICSRVRRVVIADYRVNE